MFVIHRRTNFKLSASAYFGYIELSTWCVAGDAIPLMRDAQLAAVTMQDAAYAVNSDHGAGCDIHPPPKQFCGRRLGDSALAKVYNQKISWQSPSYKGIKALSGGTAVIELDSYVPAEGLVLLPSANTGTLNCAANPNVCATAALQFNDAAKTWVVATVSLTADRQGIV